MPPKGKYGDRIDVYGQGLEPDKSLLLKTSCNSKSMNVETDDNGRFHLSNFPIDPPTFSRLVEFFRSLFSRDPTSEEVIGGTTELGKSCHISVQFSEEGGVATNFYIE